MALAPDNGGGGASAARTPSSLGHGLGAKPQKQEERIPGVEVFNNLKGHQRGEGINEESIGERVDGELSEYASNTTSSERETLDNDSSTLGSIPGSARGNHREMTQEEGESVEDVKDWEDEKEDECLSLLRVNPHARAHASHLRADLQAYAGGMSHNTTRARRRAQQSSEAGSRGTVRPAGRQGHPSRARPRCQHDHESQCCLTAPRNTPR